MLSPGPGPGVPTPDRPGLEPGPPRANTPRPGPNRLRASDGAEPDFSPTCPVSASTSGQSPGISRAGGASIGRSAHSVSASATSIGVW